MADLLITVGERSRVMGERAREAGMPETAVHAFVTAEEAAAYLGETVQKGDAILVKGSQSIRMERIVAALLEDPTDSVYLVRQDEE